jgi:hypothetical protein
VNAVKGDIVCEEGGEEKWSARGRVHWRSDDATAVDIERPEPASSLSPRVSLSSRVSLRLSLPAIEVTLPSQVDLRVLSLIVGNYPLGIGIFQTQFVLHIASLRRQIDVSSSAPQSGSERSLPPGASFTGQGLRSNHDHCTTEGPRERILGSHGLQSCLVKVHT